MVCTTYHRIDEGTCADACLLCADTCLEAFLGYCPRSIVVTTGGLTNGSCLSLGYDIVNAAEPQLTMTAGPCGTLVFDLYASNSSTVASPSAPPVALSPPPPPPPLPPPAPPPSPLTPLPPPPHPPAAAVPSEGLLDIEVVLIATAAALVGAGMVGCLVAAAWWCRKRDRPKTEYAAGTGAQASAEGTC